MLAMIERGEHCRNPVIDIGVVDRRIRTMRNVQRPSFQCREHHVAIDATEAVDSPGRCEEVPKASQGTNGVTTHHGTSPLTRWCDCEQHWIGGQELRRGRIVHAPTRDTPGKLRTPTP